MTQLKCVDTRSREISSKDDINEPGEAHEMIINIPSQGNAKSKPQGDTAFTLTTMSVLKRVNSNKCHDDVEIQDSS